MVPPTRPWHHCRCKRRPLPSVRFLPRCSISYVQATPWRGPDGPWRNPRPPVEPCPWGPRGTIRRRQHVRDSLFRQCPGPANGAASPENCFIWSGVPPRWPRLPLRPHEVRLLGDLLKVTALETTSERDRPPDLSWYEEFAIFLHFTAASLAPIFQHALDPVASAPKLSPENLSSPRMPEAPNAPSARWG